jgi:hypothetical protein
MGLRMRFDFLGIEGWAADFLRFVMMLISAYHNKS